jgi:hypothetical protein
MAGAKIDAVEVMAYSSAKLTRPTLPLLGVMPGSTVELRTGIAGIAFQGP